MRKSAHYKLLFILLGASLGIKLAIFGYAAVKAPSAKFMPDTPTYIEPGINMIEKGTFATFGDDGEIKYEINRTPGYPIFIAILNKVLKLSFDSIIIIQIILITFAGYVVYKAAYELDRNIALLASFIFLFDQPTAISCLLLLAEGLYTVFIAFFMYFFLKYLKQYRIGFLISSILMLVIATYIKPTSYYLGICLAGGVIFALFRINIKKPRINPTFNLEGFLGGTRESPVPKLKEIVRGKDNERYNFLCPKKAVAHVLILLLVFYALLGAWHYRNYIRTGNADFTTIDDADLRHMGLTYKYARYRDSEKIEMGPFLYYANQTARCVIQFFTTPGTFKNLNSKGLKVASKIYGYPWVAFWLVGLLFARYEKLPYRFLLLTILYFALVSMLVTGLCVGSRFRVPVMPLISILSASGWVRIIKLLPAPWFRTAIRCAEEERYIRKNL